jgi:predicted PurR-regulated permease PerM
VSFGIMLYLLFFFLREGAEVARKVRQAVPLPEHQKRRLQLKFNRVVRATVKGNLLVAITQGAGRVHLLGAGYPQCAGLGGADGVSVAAAGGGRGIVWAPVAAYFLLTGATWQGIVLTAFGVLVIGLVDNLLRPILVGKDTRMPDYLVLVSTLGGLAVFGLNGFVIGPLIAALFVSSWAILPRPSRRCSCRPASHAGKPAPTELHETCGSGFTREWAIEASTVYRKL